MKFFVEYKQKRMNGTFYFVYADVINFLEQWTNKYNHISEDRDLLDWLTTHHRVLTEEHRDYDPPRSFILEGYSAKYIDQERMIINTTKLFPRMYYLAPEIARICDFEVFCEKCELTYKRNQLDLERYDDLNSILLVGSAGAMMFCPNRHWLLDVMSCIS
ncbi:MAG: hypothetical protein GF353_23490 [Candidatus Lokiarchaeota archaeon]|nr:hypothetical protein [Candidatus Lokiarchaeota archaeon]